MYVKVLDVVHSDDNIFLMMSGIELQSRVLKVQCGVPKC